MFTEEELKTIDDFRASCAISSEAYSTDNHFMPSSELLEPWREAKSDHLFKLFDDKLIIKKTFNVAKLQTELEDEINQMCYGEITFGRAQRSGKPFVDAYLKKIKDLYYRHEFILYTTLSSFVSMETLVSNTISIVKPVSIPLPNGKEYKITDGSKAMKVLSKLANIWDLPGFEDFRICHSQIFNTKNSINEVTFSIHPLDYMTMSDNDIGWDSCMKWQDEGSYRQGTVEMMNSSCVIVAYIEDKHSMDIWPNHKWNNKRWRELFIVDEQMIAEVKAYPYKHLELSQAIVEWLKDLASEKLGWKYGEVVYLDSAEYNGHPIALYAGAMYNDLGTRPFHAAFNPEVGYVSIDYSGPNQCMVCGNTEVEFYNESCLACHSCQSYDICDLCSESTDGNYYEIDGYHICSYCYNERVKTCPICNEEHLDANMETIHVIPNYTDEELAKNKEWYKKVYDYYQPTDEEECVQISAVAEIYCCTECEQEVEEKYLKPGRTIHGRKFSNYDIRDCVFFNDLNELGIEEFLDGLALEEFKDSLGQYTMRHSKVVY